MNHRILGKTGFAISEIALGTWQVGGRWGEPFNEQNALRTIENALDHGVNFIDTADVYGGGLSERAVGKAVRSRGERIYVATKCGRKLNPHVAEGYTPESVTEFVEGSLKNMGLETLDLIQLHCPPTPVYYCPEVFETLERLVQAGKILHYGVSVEKVEEALKAIEYPNVATVQIIFNMFRQRPAGLFFQEAARRNIGVIVRVPLASGLLTGKISKETVFAAKDHRLINRNGEHFDKGETFAGIDFETGLQAVAELKTLFPADPGLAQFALRWILMFEAVSCVIPGASSARQAEANVAAAALPPLTGDQLAGVQSIYDRYFKQRVHHMW